MISYIAEPKQWKNNMYLLEDYALDIGEELPINALQQLTNQTT